MTLTVQEDLRCGDYATISGDRVWRCPAFSQADVVAMDDFPKGSLAMRSGGLLVRPRPTTILGRLKNGERAENSVES
jgi:hypothetical protein